MTIGAKPSGGAPRPGGPLSSVGTGLLAGAVVATTFAQTPNPLQLTGLVLVVLLTTALGWQVKVAQLQKKLSSRLLCGSWCTCCL